MEAMAGQADRHERLGRQAMGWIAALALGWELLSAMAGAAGAERAPASDQQWFVKECRNRGGTTERIGVREVKCTLPDGYTVTCNFKFNPPQCTKPGLHTVEHVSNVPAEVTNAELIKVENAPDATIVPTRATKVTTELIEDES